MTKTLFVAAVVSAVWAVAINAFVFGMHIGEEQCDKGEDPVRIVAPHRELVAEDPVVGRADA